MRVLFRKSDKKRWREVASETGVWDDRNAEVARLIPDGSSVLDLGCGAQTLRHHLGKQCYYQPCDIVQHTPGVLVCDFNAGKFPDLDRGFDFVVCSGVVEYLYDPVAFMRRVAGYGSKVVVSYNPLVPGRHRLQRMSMGWVNHMDQQAFERAMTAAGLEYRLVCTNARAELLYLAARDAGDDPMVVQG